MSNKQQSKKLINRVIIVATVILLGVAIVQQLRTPAEERTWEGKILGFPYDLRLPSKERLQAAYWNKDSADILQPKPFGLGWAINFYPLVNRATEISQTAHH